jgi:hypothetical protein
MSATALSAESNSFDGLRCTLSEADRSTVPEVNVRCNANLAATGGCFEHRCQRTTAGCASREDRRRKRARGAGLVPLIVLWFGTARAWDLRERGTGGVCGSLCPKAVVSLVDAGCKGSLLFTRGEKAKDSHSDLIVSISKT